MGAKPFVVLEYPADTSGCNFFRLLAPRLTVQSVIPNVNFTSARRFIADEGYFRDINLIHAQRQVSNAQCDYFTKFLAPVAKANGIHICYDVDDAIHMDDIPKYNRAWKAYQDMNLMENIKKMISVSTFLLVTTDYLKDYYIRRFGATEEQVLVIPNFLPKWWMGQYYDMSNSLKNFDKYKKRPRIGVIASSTHFDIENNNNGVDDFTHIIDFIKDTVTKYEWVFVGTIPTQLNDLLKQGKITMVQGSNIMNYPDVIGNLNCQAIVQPLLDNEFNRCKSNIKYLESAAIGTPFIGQDLNIYRPYTNMLFNDADELQTQLNKILTDKNKFKSIVKKQYDDLDHGRGGAGWWMENNVDIRAQFYRLTKGCIEVDVRKIIEHENKQTKKVGQQTSGLEIIR